MSIAVNMMCGPLAIAHSAALYVFRILPNRIMYMHPKSKLISAQVNEKRAAYLDTGSAAAASICRIVKIALQSTD